MAEQLRKRLQELEAENVGMLKLKEELDKEVEKLNQEMAVCVADIILLESIFV